MTHEKIFYLHESNDQWDKNHSFSNIITRYTAHGMNYHVAVHDFDAHEKVKEYSKPHCHAKEDEINIIFSTDDFKIKITIDGDEHVITKNCVVNIPAETMHSANVLEGKGFFICIRIPVNCI